MVSSNARLYEELLLRRNLVQFYGSEKLAKMWYTLNILINSNRDCWMVLDQTSNSGLIKTEFESNDCYPLLRENPRKKACFQCIRLLQNADNSVKGAFGPPKVQLWRKSQKIFSVARNSECQAIIRHSELFGFCSLSQYNLRSCSFPMLFEDKSSWHNLNLP